MSAHTRAHFAQLHHIVRNCPETLNQRDTRGLTALHRAAFLAHQDGYLEIYEYLLVRETGLYWKEKGVFVGGTRKHQAATDCLHAQSEGADPSILSDDYDPYLFPGRHAPVEMAVEMDEVR